MLNKMYQNLTFSNSVCKLSQIKQVSAENSGCKSKIDEIDKENIFEIPLSDQPINL
jgi:hypothetical protein